jgi:hypothetical protein
MSSLQEATALWKWAYAFLKLRKLNIPSCLVGKYQCYVDSHVKAVLGDISGELQRRYRRAVSTGASAGDYGVFVKSKGMGDEDRGVRWKWTPARGPL